MRYKLVAVVSVHRWHHQAVSLGQKHSFLDAVPRSPAAHSSSRWWRQPQAVPCSRTQQQECLRVVPQSSVSIRDDSLVLLYWDALLSNFPNPYTAVFPTTFFPKYFLLWCPEENRKTVMPGENCTVLLLLQSCQLPSAAPCPPPLQLLTRVTTLPTVPNGGWNEQWKTCLAPGQWARF